MLHCSNRNVEPAPELNANIDEINLFTAVVVNLAKFEYSTVHIIYQPQTRSNNDVFY